MTTSVLTPLDRDARRRLSRPALRLTGSLLLELVGIAIVWFAVRPPTPSPEPGPGVTLESAADLLDVAGRVAGWIAIVLLTYLLAVTALQLIALLSHAAAPSRPAGARLAAVTSRLGPRALAGVAAATLVLGASACGRPAVRTSGQPAVATDRVEMVLEDPSDARAVDAVVTMELDVSTSLADPGADPAPTASERVDPSTTSPSPGPDLRAQQPTAPAGPSTVVVERGDSLWDIAEAALTSRTGRPPTAAETDPYWRLLIEINRSRLVDPDRPDLIYAGQRFLLP